MSPISFSESYYYTTIVARIDSGNGYGAIRPSGACARYVWAPALVASAERRRCAGPDPTARDLGHRGRQGTGERSRDRAVHGPALLDGRTADSSARRGG